MLTRPRPYLGLTRGRAGWRVRAPGLGREMPDALACGQAVKELCDALPGDRLHSDALLASRRIMEDREVAGVLGPHVAVLHAASRLVPGLVAAAAGELAGPAAPLQGQLAARESADCVLPGARAVACEAFRPVTGAALTEVQAPSCL